VPGLIQKKVMMGTKNLLIEPAMSRAQATKALEIGIDLATGSVREGIGLIGTGEMGIGNSTAAALSFLGIASAVETRIHGRATIPYQISARAVGDKVTQRWIVPSVASEARNWRGMRVLLLPTLNDYAIVLGRLPLDVSAQMARDELLGSAEAGKLAVVCETPSGPVVEFYNGNGRHGAVPQTGAATISLAIRSNPCLGHYFPNGRLTYLTKKGRRKAQLPAVSDTKCGRLAVEMPPISVRLDPVEVELVA